MNSKPLPKNKKIKKKTTKQLKAILDKVFSEYIRRKYANAIGHTRCVTCNKYAPWNELQNGHYISRSSLATRYDEENCHPQCAACNIFKNGNMPSYTLFLQRKYGNDIVAKLYKKSLEITKDFPYQQFIDHYKIEISLLTATSGL